MVQLCCVGHLAPQVSNDPLLGQQRRLALPHLQHIANTENVEHLDVVALHGTYKQKFIVDNIYSKNIVELQEGLI